MDNQFLARNHLVLALAVFLVGLALLSRPALVTAQNGACPGNTYLLGSPEGTWPSDLSACSYNLLTTYMTNDPLDRFPCDQNVAMYTNDGGLGWDTNEVVYVPSASQYYGGQFRVRFLIWGHGNVTQHFIPPGLVMDENTLLLQHYNQNAILVGAYTRQMDQYPYVDTYWIDAGVYYYYRVYIVEEVFGSADGQGGFMKVTISRPDGSNEGVYQVKVGSLRWGNVNDAMPAHCPIPNANIPQTPTPILPTATPPPTWTPNPSATHTPTPFITPPATSVGNTPPPQWTVTPYVFPTTKAENTPTPWPPYVIATIAWPTLQPTEVIAVSTLDGSAAGLDTLAETVMEEWQSSLEFGEEAGDPNNPTGTGLASGSHVAGEIETVIGTPISYVKSIEQVMPNSAGYIAFLLLLASWVPFNMIAKFSLAVAARLFELIRRIVELIPGM